MHEPLCSIANKGAARLVNHFFYQVPTKGMVFQNRVSYEEILTNNYHCVSLLYLHDMSKNMPKKTEFLDMETAEFKLNGVTTTN